MKNNIELALNKKYKEGLKELKKEIEQESPGWTKERRKEYLLQEMLKCLIFLTPIYEWYEDATERNVDYLTKKVIQVFARYEYWKKKLHKFFMEYKFTMLREPGNNKITSDMIERAKEYPIENIVKVNKKGFALCPEHDDHRPSMDCRNNFCYCYACGWTGSVLDLYMKLHNTDFATAVEFLCK